VGVTRQTSHIPHGSSASLIDCGRREYQLH
jgi:hypothetical protein